MNSWHVYELLKRYNGNIVISELEEKFKSLTTQELCEGINEWLLLQKRINTFSSKPCRIKRSLPPSY